MHSLHLTCDLEHMPVLKHITCHVSHQQRTQRSLTYTATIASLVTHLPVTLLTLQLIIRPPFYHFHSSRASCKWVSYFVTNSLANIQLFFRSLVPLFRPNSHHFPQSFTIRASCRLGGAHHHNMPITSLPSSIVSVIFTFLPPSSHICLACACTGFERESWQPASLTSPLTLTATMLPDDSHLHQSLRRFQPQHLDVSRFPELITDTLESIMHTFPRLPSLRLPAKPPNFTFITNDIDHEARPIKGYHVSQLSALTTLTSLEVAGRIDSLLPYSSLTTLRSLRLQRINLQLSLQLPPSITSLATVTDEAIGNAPHTPIINHLSSLRHLTYHCYDRYSAIPVHQSPHTDTSFSA